MSVSRRFSSHVVLAGRLFVIGGVDAQNRLENTVEYYVPLTDKWKTVAPMRHKRVASAACALNGIIYVFGGEGPEGFHHSIEKYNPRENAWTEVSYTL